MVKGERPGKCEIVEDGLPCCALESKIVDVGLERFVLAPDALELAD